MALDISQRLHRLGRFVLHVTRRFQDDQCFQVASSLTYTTLLSLVPLITVALTLISAFPTFREFTQHVNDFLAQNVLPEGIRHAITTYIEEFTEKAARLTALGLAGLALTSFLMMFTIERAFNHIWRVRHGRPLAQRLFVYWAFLTLGPTLIGASLTITTYVLTRSLSVVEGVPGAGMVWRLVPPLFTIAAFTLLYYFVPGRPVAPRHALIGGLVAGALFELMKRGFALYVMHSPTYAIVYGTFAAIPAFLLWIYASWVVIVLGAVVTALLPDYRFLRAEKHAPPGAEFTDALGVLRVLIECQMRSETPSVRTISERSGVTREASEAVLDRLLDAGWVSRAMGWRWLLACDPDRVTIAQIYRRFLIEPERLHERSDASRELLGKIAASIDAQMAAPIRCLAEARKEEGRARPATAHGGGAERAREAAEPVRRE
jgi:membrane protein